MCGPRSLSVGSIGLDLGEPDPVFLGASSLWAFQKGACEVVHTAVCHSSQCDLTDFVEVVMFKWA